MGISPFDKFLRTKIPIRFPTTEEIIVKKSHKNRYLFSNSIPPKIKKGKSTFWRRILFKINVKIGLSLFFHKSYDIINGKFFLPIRKTGLNDNYHRKMSQEKTRNQKGQDPITKKVLKSKRANFYTLYASFFFKNYTHLFFIIKRIIPYIETIRYWIILYIETIRYRIVKHAYSFF